MFKYVKFNKVKTEHTVLEFRGSSEDIIITNFSGIEQNIVSISCEDEDMMDAVIDVQPTEIECEVIDQDAFKEYVQYSDQLNRIRKRVKEKIAQRYDIADEIAISKLAEDDDKKIAYQDYVDECIAFGVELKEKIGY